MYKDEKGFVAALPSSQAPDPWSQGGGTGGGRGRGTPRSGNPGQGDPCCTRMLLPTFVLISSLFIIHVY